MEKINYKFEGCDITFVESENKWLLSRGGGHGAEGSTYSTKQFLKEIDNLIESELNYIENLKKLKILISSKEEYGTKKYVKLTSKPNTYFNEGTEVFKVYFEPAQNTRFTLKEFNEGVNKYGYIFCSGQKGIGSDIHHSDIHDFIIEFVEEQYAK